MKTATWIILFCCFAFTGPALAFKSQLTVGFERWDWSEDYDPDFGAGSEGDYTQDEIFAVYTYFLTPVEDNGGPLDLLPFFYSRSSYVYGEYYTGDREFELDDSDYTSDRDWTGYGAGGRFYVTPDTGIGVGYFTQDGDWEDNDAVLDDSYDEDRDGWNVSLRHYLDESSRVMVRFSQTDRERNADSGYERTDEYEWLVFSYAVVTGEMPNFYVDFNYGIGSREREDSDDSNVDHDLSRIGITVGPVYRYFALYFSYDRINWDPDGDGFDADETNFQISPRYWFSEQLMLGGDVTYWSWDETGDSYEFEESGNEIEVKLRYRF